MSVASRPSTRASKLPVTQLVFVAQGVCPRSTPCVCALRGFLPGRVFPDRTTRRHGLARPPPNWVGWAEEVVTNGRIDTREASRGIKKRTVQGQLERFLDPHRAPKLSGTFDPPLASSTLVFLGGGCPILRLDGGSVSVGQHICPQLSGARGEHASILDTCRLGLCSWRR